MRATQVRPGAAQHVARGEAKAPLYRASLSACLTLAIGLAEEVSVVGCHRGALDASARASPSNYGNACARRHHWLGRVALGEERNPTCPGQQRAVGHFPPCAGRPDDKPTSSHRIADLVRARDSRANAKKQKKPDARPGRSASRGDAQGSRSIQASSNKRRTRTCRSRLCWRPGTCQEQGGV
ncbi:hypothetical protein FQZ97_1019800 [compost metagenome]